MTAGRQGSHESAPRAAEGARQRLHATCVLAGRRGVLITGPSGSGKSSLALEMIDSPGHAAGGPLVTAKLVADDQVLVERRGRELSASPPRELAGRLEVRGLGIMEVPFEPCAALGLVVQLAPWRTIERLPEPETTRILAVPLPLIRIDASRPRACARLRAALAHLGLT